MNNWFNEPFHPRARRGGEERFGKRYAAGEFLPFYIPRPAMPQIEEEDYPEFIEWAAQRGIDIVVRYLPPTKLRMHQVPDKLNYDKFVATGVQNKPVFVSRDLYILDGNHRWMYHVHEGHSHVPCFEIKLTFEDAIGLMFAFEKTYTVEGDE